MKIFKNWRRRRQIKQNVDHLDNRLVSLEKKETELKKRIDHLEAEAGKLGAIDRTLSDAEKLAYQQAADWLRLVNTVTWTLSSIFFVGAVIALSNAIQSHDASWRLVIGLGVLSSVAIWAYFDQRYSKTAANARSALKEIESRWDPKFQFYTAQEKSVRFAGIISLTFYLTYLVPAAGAIAVVLRGIGQIFLGR
jgi:hypothetical protein